jgi:hypothetical protein
MLSIAAKLPTFEGPSSFIWSERGAAVCREPRKPAGELSLR